MCPKMDKEPKQEVFDYNPRRAIILLAKEGDWSAISVLQKGCCGAGVEDFY